MGNGNGRGAVDGRDDPAFASDESGWDGGKTKRNRKKRRRKWESAIAEKYIQVNAHSDSPLGVSGEVWMLGN